MPTSKLRQHNLTLGRAGEQRALNLLLDKHYQLLARNFRHGQDEIDLIMFDPQHQELVFIEVKTRSTDDLIDPASAVDHRKLQAQVNAAHHFLQSTANKSHPAIISQADYRFDLVTVLPQQLEHYENITWP